MGSLRRDLVYAFRNLRKSPGYALITIVTLALGIGANTAIFSVVNGVILKPLGYPEPERLIFITSQFPTLGFDQFWVSPPEFVEFRDRNQAFENVGAYRSGAVNLGTPEQPRRVNSAVVTSELMPVLGVQPLRGRMFTREDTLPGAEDVGVLSAEVWRASFTGDESIIGRVIPVDGIPTRIVGIMPDGYDIHDEKVEVWLPLTLDPANPGGRGSHFLYLVGRLKPGISLTQARADLETMLQQWATVNPNAHVPSPKNHRLRYDGLQDDMIGGMRTALWVLQGAVGFVLLIACANLANLLLARAESRQREFAIRSALGAGRGTILRQFLTEGILLSLIGGAVGAALGYAALRALLAADPDSVPRSAEIALDPAVLLFTLGVSVLTGVLFGLAPLLNLRQRAVNMTLKESGQRSTAGQARARVRSALVAAEVALAVVLVIGAGLLLRSFWNLMSVDAGFNRSNLATFGLVLPTTTYASPQSRVDFFQRLTARLAEIPGVHGTAAMTGLPPYRQVNANDVDFETYQATGEGDAVENVDYFQTISLDYLKTMGIPVVDGRDFTLADVQGAPAVLVNETLVKTFFKGRSPVGQRVNPFVIGAKTPMFNIVGVVRDVKQGGLESRTGTELYFLAEQGPRIVDFAPRNMNIVVRSGLPFDAVAPQVRRVVQSMDSTLPIVRLQTMDDVFGTSVSRPRLLAQLLGTFAGLALLLAAVGTYGILAYTVTERKKEIGIHMALGATRSNVMNRILGQGLRLTAVGLVVGLAAAFGLTRLLQAQLFNVQPTDPLTMVSVAAFITMVALVACYIPAARATRVDPMVVLREE
jgi:predicted permease